ncbi:hypothetical protein GCM10009678_72290 [Actinomadura kijaniata]|uniref:Uncharacterized protein n=1 Tax=Actinomadura namibiensis TaxID=182080 RepID=A0A7W3LYM7_ACTNM|nr:phage tail protein [Actinomadura namibiensis]MBA8956587.1 hypothetical protein [Actinomadura namibiensis]
MTPETTEATRRLQALLPAHLTGRDPATGVADPTDAMAALLTAVGEELQVLEDDIAMLYDSWFIETCPEWVVPYLADLVGLDALPADLGPGVSRRSIVANTIAYRRRKGTVAILERIARDITGWPARAVEFYCLLATTAHLNHVRLDRAATADLRKAGRLEHCGGHAAGALDPLAHTAEARSITRGRGRYGIANVGVFLFGWQTYDVEWATARPSDAPGEFTADPLGRSAPLFATPPAEPAVEELADEADLPVPLRPRRLLDLLRAARSGPAAPRDLPVGVRLDATSAPVPATHLRVCGLEDLLPGTPDLQVMIDARNGRLHAFREGQPPPRQLQVRYTYGGIADLGAGPYDRRDLHEQALASDAYLGTRGTTGQIAVNAAGARDLSVTTLGAALNAARLAWETPGDSSAAGGTFVITVADNATYVEDLTVTIPAATRLVIVAATPPPGGPADPGEYDFAGLRPHLRGRIQVTGEPGSSLVLDGLVIEGDLTAAPGHLGSLTLAQSTLAGSLTVAGNPAGSTNGELSVRLLRTVTGPVALAETVPALAMTGSIVDPQLSATAATAAVTAPGARLAVDTCTLLGTVDTRLLDASSTLLTARTTATHRQTGCVRFSYVAPGSRIPHRYRCVPEGPDDRSVPVFASLDPASPQYAALARGCPASIAEGGEGDAEMGAHHHLHRPQRLRAARAQLAPYVPAGLEIGIIGS